MINTVFGIAVTIVALGTIWYMWQYAQTAIPDDEPEESYSGAEEKRWKESA